MEKETLKGTELNRFRDLMKICNDSDKINANVRKEIKQLIQNSPECKEYVQAQEDMYPVALSTRIENMSCSDSFREVMYVKCEELRQELGYSTSNRLEKLAIEQIVLCWFNHHQTEIEHANILSQSPSIELGIYWEKRLAFASRRYTRALELLSKMRKMNLVVQVNNANNQFINSK
ncbi:hypothetical protein [Adhaeribacter rhizoryzae]|uniref:Uncharacterized protein n=1 Tax=Adhaeribacter rhizoryzae TaxID=2607907 RepID=A0A5M6D6X9_9BACT|nr:hypothetical protein [Adhaeribacter rhizoryzae]KAA5542426.1 hypothetical protein F0145_18420 [Adhaeribacter rhizoryzae]